MNFYYEIEVRQLIMPNGDWEVVYNPGEESEFSDDVIYFAVCDLIAKPVIGETLLEDEDSRGVILPVVFSFAFT